MSDKNTPAVPEGVDAAIPFPPMPKYVCKHYMFGEMFDRMAMHQYAMRYADLVGTQQREAGRRDMQQVAEDYSDMIRNICFQWGAGGYNSEGLLPVKTAESKLRWIIDDVQRVTTRQPVAPKLTEIPQAWIDENLHSYFSYSGNRDSIMWASLEDIALFARAVEKEARAASPVTPVSQDLATQLQVAKVLPPVSALTDEQIAAVTEATKTLTHWIGLIKEGSPVGTITLGYILTAMGSLKSALNLPYGDEQ